MKINIRNLGVIQEAQIQLKPLTVFIGENGTGKTWTAYALAGIFGAFGYSQYLKSYLAGQTGFQYPPIEEAIKQVLENGTGKINLAEFVRDYAEIYFNQIAQSLPQWINGFMATQRVNFEHTKIELELPESSKSKMLNELKATQKKGEVSIAVKKNSPLIFLNSLKEKDTDELYYYLKVKSQKIPQAIVNNELREFIVSETFKIIQKALFLNVYIFPTERITFITFPFSPIQNKDVKRKRTYNENKNDEMLLSTPIRDFLLTMAISHDMLSKRKAQEIKQPDISRFIELANVLENDILLGNVSFEERGQQIELIYSPAENVKLELNVSSSMVKELAPLAIYLRYVAQPGDLLVIDEPEMNLHPAAQVEITEFLGMLVNAGLNVLITTHSPYIVDHLSNLIQAKQTNRLTALKEHFYLEQETAFISKDDLAVYLFEDNTTKNILAEDGGVDWETFSDISRSLSRIYSKIIA